ncbi:MAG: hypothetical protein IJW86_10790 [Clostridia bacterium]|nr:hypothetical protein [Clostridia bacterium]MBQ7296657.1 hypothetical protein [Clostridia bacterium]
MKNELKAYYSEIEKNLICERRQKSAFMAELKANIDEFLAISPDADIERIKAEFGTPEEIADSFISNSNAGVIKKRFDIKKSILIAIALALVIYLAFVVISLIDVHTEAHGYIEEGIMMISAFKGGAVL